MFPQYNQVRANSPAAPSAADQSAFRGGFDGIRKAIGGALPQPATPMVGRMAPPTPQVQLPRPVVSTPVSPAPIRDNTTRPLQPTVQAQPSQMRPELAALAEGLRARGMNPQQIMSSPQFRQLGQSLLATQDQAAFHQGFANVNPGLVRYGMRTS